MAVEADEADVLWKWHVVSSAAPYPAAGSGHSAMDLLEYQGKQLFAKPGVTVPEGRPATSVREAVQAAEQLGYPVVIKAQVLIGGRGKAGGIKLAKDRAEAEEHSNAILGMDIKGFTVH